MLTMNPEQKDNFIPGSCDDPQTQQNIIEELQREVYFILQLISNDLFQKYTHLCALPYLLNESKIGRPLIAALMNYASAISAGDCKSGKKKCLTIS